MLETFALVLNANMTNLDGWFVDAALSLTLSKRPKPDRFQAGQAIVISQSNDTYFAAVGCLEGTSLEGHILHFKKRIRFIIPVMLVNSDGPGSPLTLGKGFCNDFMYLDHDAEKAILAEAKGLRDAPPLGSIDTSV